MSHPPQDAIDAAALIGLPHPESIDSISSNGRSRAWRVVCGGAAWMIKRFDAGELERGRAEAVILAHLWEESGSAYEVPEVFLGAGGRAFALDGEGGLTLATRWCAGEKRTWRALGARQWAGLGGALGALHARLRALDPEGAGLRLERLGSRRASGIAQASEDIEAQARSVAASGRAPEGAAGSFEDRQGLLLECAQGWVWPEGSGQIVHNDFNQHNFLFAGEDLERIVVLDWERAAVAPAEFEVVRCLNLLPLVDPAGAGAFLGAYLDAAPLDRGLLGAMVDVCLIDHAIKHWPTLAWIEGQAWAEAHFEEHFEIVRILRRGRGALRRFFEGA